MTCAVYVNMGKVKKRVEGQGNASSLFDQEDL